MLITNYVHTIVISINKTCAYIHVLVFYIAAILNYYSYTDFFFLVGRYMFYILTDTILLFSGKKFTYFASAYPVAARGLEK